MDIDNGSEYIFFSDGTVIDIYDKPEEAPASSVVGSWQLSENKLILKFEENGDYEQLVPFVNVVELNESMLILDSYSKNGNYEAYEKDTFIKVTQ